MLPQKITQFLIREQIKKKKQLKWWLVYGAPRTGTSYLTKLISNCSRLIVSDWGLTNMLKLVPEANYIKFDRERALKDISNNILDNAYLGRGNQLDLIFKQAAIGLEEYKNLVKMWGNPERIFFCLREPAGYMASAKKKFPHQNIDFMQKNYIGVLNRYEHIGGDIIEYKPDLETKDYLLFLKPLQLDENRVIKFAYQGKTLAEDTNEQMWSAYHQFKEKYQDKILNQANQ